MTAVEWLVENIIQLNAARKYGVISWNTYLSKQEELFEQAKEMEEKQAIDKYSNVSRLEVIQHSDPYNGRAYTNYNAKDVDLQIQDEGKTLKIFLK